MDQRLIEALNKQATAERQNEAIYIALANRLDTSNLTGLARFMRKAGVEEAGHARKFMDYLIDRGCESIVEALDGVNVPSTDMLQIGATCFELALQREMVTTDAIVALYQQAEDAGDVQTCVFLQPFVAEQTSSVREYTELAAKMRFAAGCPSAVLAMDHELGE